MRTTAIATDAFLDLRPSEPMLPLLVKGLFGERQQRALADARRTTSTSLVALTHYVKSRPLGDVTVSTTLGDKKVLAGDFSGKSTHIRRASVAAGCGEATDGAAARSSATGGEVYYSSVLRFRRDVAHQKPYEHEITVRREYLDPTTDAPIDPKKGVKVGGMVRVRVTVSSPETRNHLAIDDPVPAGLEPLNTRLATSGGVPKKEAGRSRGEPRDLDDWWRPSFREIRDDRVLVFIDDLYAGPASFDYLARADDRRDVRRPRHDRRGDVPAARSRRAWPPGTFVVTGVADARRRQLPQVPALRAPDGDRAGVRRSSRRRWRGGSRCTSGRSRASGSSRGARRR